MSQHNFRLYRFRECSTESPLPFGEDSLTIAQALTTFPQSILTYNATTMDTVNSTNSNTTVNNTLNESSDVIPPWRPSPRLRNLHTRFQNTILFQHICLPCAFCAQLLYPTKAKWIDYDSNYTYPLEIHFPNVELYIKNDGLSLKISVCSKCKSPNKRRPCPQLHPIPDEINAIPLMQRQFLSPVFLHCSLGRSLDANPYTEYRTLVGDMTFSKNMRALKLYSGILGAMLRDPSTQNELSWLTPQLLTAANWLKQYNCYIKPFTQFLSTPSSIAAAANSNRFPIAEHARSDYNAPNFRQNEIVISANNFPAEIHNEDFHYTYLMAGFVRTSNGTKMPLSFNSPELEPLLFPDIFPDGKGHFHDRQQTASNDNLAAETYGKYIKHRLLCADSRFRLHPLWPSFSYMQLEKLRNHQHTMRFWRQQSSDKIYRPPTAAELITRSIYTGNRTINEKITTTLPSFIRTGDTYFHEKQLHVNSMINEYGLPSLFLTLTMAEGKWKHLNEILKATDNNNTIPSNRPLHVALDFVHRYQQLKKHVWTKPNNSNWGDLLHFFERTEFQNRGAAHMHTILWADMNHENMISNNIIRSDLPDPNTEPELYQLVKSHQIHTCNPQKCGGPAPPGQTCKRNFPRPYSHSTYHNHTELRYIYRCVKEEDRWVVPYHAPTLLIWNGHINAQYVTSKNLGKYLTKYVVKPEPSHLFNISEGDKYREHIIARRLGSMECMFLLLGEKICNSSVQVMYLPTEPATTRSRSIRPISTIDDDDDDPYWKDHVEKYFARPHADEFENMRYPNYFKNYRFSTKQPSRLSQVPLHRDDLNYYVIKRNSQIIVRYRYLKPQDGETFFYQQLLLTVPCRSEAELLGNYRSYRARFLDIYPEFHQSLIEQINTNNNQFYRSINIQFGQIMTTLLNDLQQTVSPSIAEILTKQLDVLKLTPPILPQMITLDLPEEQYTIMNKITTNLGPIQKKKYPYFFITGSAGTGKSYMIKLLINWLNSHRKPYLLLAPTGVAAQNIGGSTIHSALRLTQTSSGFHTLIFYDTQHRNSLLKIDTIIIDEISMVSASLLTFLSNLFARLHSNDIAFGGKNVILVGDLAQLPPIRATSVFHSSVWHIFYPLFLRRPKRQENDLQFYKLLEEVRLGRISSHSWNLITKKANEHTMLQPIDSMLTSTFIVGLRKTADQINRTICNALPMEDEKFLISKSIDFVDGIQISNEKFLSEFKLKTNLPPSIRLQQGARVMFLNNSLFEIGICNGTIGVITDLDKITPSVTVAFCVHGAIVHKPIVKQTQYFYTNGQRASRTQFPLQNSFALTVHKTQGLTLPKVFLALDSQLFSPGQAYVALSRCPTWDQIKIQSFHKDAFITDPEVIREYDRLEQLTLNVLPIS